MHRRETFLFLCWSEPAWRREMNSSSFLPPWLCCRHWFTHEPLFSEAPKNICFPEIKGPSSFWIILSWSDPLCSLHITDPDLNKFHKVVGLFECLSYSVCTYSSIFWFKMLVGNSFQRPHFSLRIFLNVEKTYTYFPKTIQYINLTVNIESNNNSPASYPIDL